MRFPGNINAVGVSAWRRRERRYMEIHSEVQCIHQGLFNRIHHFVRFSINFDLQNWPYGVTHQVKM